MKFSDLATDPKLESEGVRFDLVPANPETGTPAVWIKVARIGNPEFQELYRRLMKPHQVAESMNQLPEKVKTEILIECLAHTIVKDWGGWTDDAGATLPYSAAAAVKAMTEARDVRDLVVSCATNSERYRRQTVEAEAGN
jgi:hypothetical protein